eukprot:jgi/Botrbrau1/6106/Bobra.331_2s0003.1
MMDIARQVIQGLLMQPEAQRLLHFFARPVTIAFMVPALGWLRSRGRNKNLKRQLILAEAKITRLESETEAVLKQIKLLRDLTAPELKLLENDIISWHKKELHQLFDDLMVAEGSIMNCVEKFQRKLDGSMELQTVESKGETSVGVMAPFTSVEQSYDVPYDRRADTHAPEGHPSGQSKQGTAIRLSPAADLLTQMLHVNSMSEPLNVLSPLQPTVNNVVTRIPRPANGSMGKLPQNQAFAHKHASKEN